jgi:DnaJ-class molecular chaperone
MGTYLMKPEVTLYDVLEISPRACHEVVKAAYRCLAQFHHPDKNIVSENGFANDKQVLINNAYAVLSDPVMRRNYDRGIGLDGPMLDRRGTHSTNEAWIGSVGSGAKLSRPFGFRPL